MNKRKVVDDSQTRMIAEILLYLERNNILLEKRTVDQLLNEMEEKIEEVGLQFVSIRKGHPGELARPRRFELVAALNRLRSLRCE
ncbi:hypothetical protein [Halalkalibacter lacteus]|uniref:hypothetical protein n=1 Tax=Halalkalibacter lacteus TaxID=3090663 RepID=UPI002FC8273C